jgi:hypothetical protein
MRSDKQVFLVLLAILAVFFAGSLQATRSQVSVVKSTLTKLEKWGGLSLPIGTEVYRNSWGIQTAFLRQKVAYCQWSFPAGTKLLFGSKNGIGPLMYSAELGEEEKMGVLSIPKGTEVIYTDDICVVDSFITHGAKIDFGYVKLDGWIYLYPNDKLKLASQQVAVDIHGVSAMGQFQFWENGWLREFTSGKAQMIKDIPVKAKVCVQLNEKGEPINFVLSKSHRFLKDEFKENDRVQVNPSGKASLAYRPKVFGNPMSNC